jgi:hypothetical protein
MEESHIVTVDHSEIRRWAERYGGRPEILDDPTSKRDRVGIRIDFPGPKDDADIAESSHARVISWDEFFRLFEELKLLFVYREDDDSSDKSSSYRFERRTG